MNAQSQVHEFSSPAADAQRRNHSMWAVTGSVRLAATPLRILYAFTIPEYFEACLVAPGVDYARCEQDRASINCLRICFFRGPHEVKRIEAVYAQPRLHLLEMQWRATSASSVEPTRLRVLLRPRMNETLVHLQHSGLPTVQEWGWHQQMWKDSLERMRTLIR